MRRQDGSVDFNKEWEDYKVGFGSLTGEFWAGNVFYSHVYTNTHKCIHTHTHTHTQRGIFTKQNQ